MDAATLTRFTTQALLLALLLALPALGGALAAGLLARVLERGAGLQQPTLLPLLRLLGVAAGLALGGAWIGGELLEFFRLVFEALAGR